MNDDIQELTAGEFMAARFIETDHDLAFRLQLEEAITASLQSPQPPIESETKKFIHNQKLAHEIFHRPYGEGSSSSKTDGSEVFRVYFKGLVSEERVKNNKTVTMAGIGVAICDSKDELMFEMKKPLDLIKDGRISRGSVEVKALIEALSFAIALDLKRIVFYCDYHTLYQHVSGQWRPKQEKIKRFVDEVNILRKSFVSPCLLSEKMSNLQLSLQEKQ